VNKSIYIIPNMDCASEVQLIRMKLEGLPNVSSLNVDLTARKLEVIHSNDHEPIFNILRLLHLGVRYVETIFIDYEPESAELERERKALFQVLIINFFFFLLESLMGLIGHSMGLVADGLDMLADSIVFALSLFVSGRSLRKKKRVATFSGYLQMALAVLGVVEVVRRFAGAGEMPSFQKMIGISALALLGNTLSLYLLQKRKSHDAHMQASVIFTSNDVLINIGVLVAGGLVYLTHSNIPDLLIGLTVFLIVARGAIRILQLGT
jgi:Co/Zn/Cd efflux system component